MDIKYKQYVIMPMNPYMSVGKRCSQVAHSTFMALDKQKGYNDNCVDTFGVDY